MGLGILAIVAMLRLQLPDADAGGPRALLFDVPSSIHEGEAEEAVLSVGLLQVRRPTLSHWLEGLRAAASDDGVEALVLRIGTLDWDLAQVCEVRDAVHVFRAAGKPVYASLAAGGEAEYLLASAADRIAMPEHARLWLDGLAVSALFMRGAYDKLDIHPNFDAVGSYKSGVEAYTRESLSPAAREALEDHLDDTFDCLVDSIAVSRALSAESVRRLLDEGPFLAGEARTRGLIDTIALAVDVDSMATRSGALRQQRLEEYLDGLGPEPRAPRIAWVALEGIITPGKSRETGWQGRTIGARSVVPLLHRLAGDSRVRAVVLRIQSPGGDAGASDEIWQAVDRLRHEKPVIVSLAGVAASGGYYIASASDAIVAHPMSLTGSIGVFGGKLNLLGLYRKLGLNVETIGRGRRAGMLSPFRDFTPDEASLFRRQLEDSYERFIDRVARGRHLSRAEAESAGQGRIWSGNAALELGLVDELGGIATTLDRVRTRLELAPGQPLQVEYHPSASRPWLARILEGVLPDPDSESGAFVDLERALGQWSEFSDGAVLAWMPFEVRIR
jgi:protease-4